MLRGSIIVRADWDPESGVWVATSGDVDGLGIEAATMEALGPKVMSPVTEPLDLKKRKLSQIICQDFASL
jgi:hypothetical protein